MILLGIDVGTTSVKAVAVDTSGHVLIDAQRDYPLLMPQPGHVELDPATVWRATRRVVSDVASSLATGPAAIGISALGEAFLPVDTRSRPLGAAIVSFDQRALGEYEHAMAAIGRERFRATSGTRPLPHYAAFKWMWWRRYRPDVYAQTAAFIGLGSFIARRLGAAPAIDPSLAIRTALYDPRDGSWDAALAHALGIKAELLPVVLPADRVCGAVSLSAASSLGLTAGTPIVTGGLDQACAAYELDTHGEQGMLTLGTTSVVCLTRPTPAEIPEQIPAVPHVDGASWLAMAGTPAGGSALHWFRDIVKRRSRRERAPEPDFDALVESAELLRTPVLFMPHLGGSRVAFDAPDASGAFLNLTHASSREHLTRAVLDGVAYEIEVLLSRLRAGGLGVSGLRANGGGSRSRGWMQIIADATRLPIASTASSQSAAKGAARLASSAVGAALASTRDVPVEFRVEPREAWRDYHEERLGEFLATYDALRDLGARGVIRT